PRRPLGRPAPAGSCPRPTAARQRRRAADSARRTDTACAARAGRAAPARDRGARRVARAPSASAANPRSTPSPRAAPARPATAPTDWRPTRSRNPPPHRGFQPMYRQPQQQRTEGEPHERLVVAAVLQAEDLLSLEAVDLLPHLQEGGRIAGGEEPSLRHG